MAAKRTSLKRGGFASLLTTPGAARHPSLKRRGLGSPPEKTFFRSPLRLLFFSSYVEFELPTAGAALFQTAEFERADFRHRGLQIHRNELAGLAAQRRFNGSDFFELFLSGNIIDCVAGAVFAANGGGEEPEHGRFADDKRKFLR